MKVSLKHLLSNKVTTEELSRLRSFKLSSILKILQSFKGDISFICNEVILEDIWLLKIRTTIIEINPFLASELLGQYGYKNIKGFNQVIKVNRLLNALMLNKTKIINDIGSIE